MLENTDLQMGTIWDLLRRESRADKRKKKSLSGKMKVKEKDKRDLVRLFLVCSNFCSEKEKKIIYIF